LDFWFHVWWVYRQFAINLEYKVPKKPINKTQDVTTGVGKILCVWDPLLQAKIDELAGFRTGFSDDAQQARGRIVNLPLTAHAVETALVQIAEEVLSLMVERFQRGRHRFDYGIVKDK
jgi:hypothetical protein